MTGVKTPDLKKYFEEAESWDKNQVKAAKRSRNFAWACAGVSAGLAGLGLLAVASLAPLKSVEAFMVRVDDTSGFVEVQSALTGTKELTYNEAVTKSFLGQYVRTREGWVPAAAEENFRQVAIMSSAVEQSRWAEAFRPSNPESPQVLYGPNATVDIKIRSVTFVNDKVGNVRFVRTVRQAQQVTSTNWIATVTFAYSQAPLSEADRLLNPLGFQAVSYRADPENVQ